jgi:hypothetical protein
VASEKRKGGRTTPKGTRPAHLRPVPGTPGDASPIDDVIDTSARQLLDEDDPVAVETWASGMLALFDNARARARLDGMDAPPFEQAVIERCRQRCDRGALVVAAGLAAVLPPPEDRDARSTLAELRASVSGAPPWVDIVGTASPTRAWLASDVFGDQDSLVVAFSQEGDPGQHALVVLVDHNLSGQAKDAWIAADPDDVVAAWKSHMDAHMRIDEVTVDEALRRLRDAMAMSDLWNGDSDLRSEEFAQHRALIWARLRRAGLSDDTAAVIQVSTKEREALVGEFMASAEGDEVRLRLADTEVELLVHDLVGLRSDFEGRPLRWSPTVALQVLLDLAPRKLLLDADQTAALPEVVRAFVRFAGARTGLHDRFVQETLATIEDVEHEFVDRVADPAAAGPAKTVLAMLQSRGVDLNDIDAISVALQDGMPMHLPEPAPKRRRSTTDAPAELVISAEGAPILARLATLVGFYGNGRKLTQTGQPTLADARALVALVGTEDRLDETIGDKTFKTQSATELPELGFTIRWAIASGALRKEHGKLRATAAWGKLEEKPLQRWLKAADALPSLGPLAGFFAHARYRGGDELLDDFAPAILHLLHAGPQPFDTVLDWICERAESDYEWLVPYMQEPEQRRRSLGGDLDLLARIIGWAGIAERIGATWEPDRYHATRRRPVGGTLRLTPVGRWWLADTR